MNIRKLLITGPPCVGKSTMSELYFLNSLSTHYKIPIILNNLPEGLKKQLNEDKTLKDLEYWKIVSSKLSEIDQEKGFIIYGFPRTEAQVKLLEEKLEFSLIILLTQPPELIYAKASHRKFCETCRKFYCNLEFKLPPYTLPNIFPSVHLTCPVCGGELIKRKDDSPVSVKRRFFQFQVFSSFLESHFSESSKFLHFPLYNGINDLQSLISKIDLSVNRHSLP